MLKLILILIIIALLVVLLKPLYKAIKRRQLENKLRRNPPEMVRFAVKLPPDSDKSNIKMARFWDRLHRQLPQDEKTMQENLNSIHVAIIGEGTSVGQAPRVRFMVWCHPQLAERVQIALSESYESELAITEIDPKKDPFFVYTEAVKSHEEWQLRVAQAELEAKRQANQEDQEEDEG